MKTVYMVGWGTESLYGTVDDPCCEMFTDLESAIAFYDGLDIRFDWLVEYNTSNHISRDRVQAKWLSQNTDSDDYMDHERFLRHDTYGIAEYRMEQED